MKRWMIGFLAVAMVYLVQIPGFAATQESYTMDILVNGSTSCQVEQGDIVTVSLTMSKQDASNFDLYCMQDYVCFDPGYVQYVEDSLEVYTAGGEWKTPLFQASAVSVPAREENANRIFINRASDDAQPLASGVTVLTFQLKAVNTGSTELTNGVMEVFRDPYHLHEVVGENATITVVEKGSTEQSPAPQPSTDPNPQPSASTQPDPQPSASARPDPQPSASTQPEVSPTASVQPDHQPSPPVQDADTPATGDSSGLLLYVAGLAAAASLLCATIAAYRKRV